MGGLDDSGSSVKQAPTAGFRAVLKDIGRASAESLENGQHARIAALLLVSPPTFGMLLGGALAALFQALTAPLRPDDFGITVGMCCVSGLVVSGVLLRAWRVRRGSPTRFPRLSRLMPYTAAAGILLGLCVALKHAH